MLTIKPQVQYQRRFVVCRWRREGVMEALVAELGWLVAGGTLGIVLMALLFIAKDSGRSGDDGEIAEEHPGEGR